MPAGDRFVDVNPRDLEAMLQALGFERRVQGSEVVYARRNHNDRNVVVKVYTSISVSSEAARGCGQDAIRVTVAYEGDGKSFGITKMPRIYRTGSTQAVLHRVHERAREAYGVANEWIKRNS